MVIDRNSHVLREPKPESRVSAPSSRVQKLLKGIAFSTLTDAAILVGMAGILQENATEKYVTEWVGGRVHSYVDVRFYGLRRADLVTYGLTETFSVEQKKIMLHG